MEPASHELRRHPRGTRWAAIGITSLAPAVFDAAHLAARGEDLHLAAVGFGFAQMSLSLVALTAAFDAGQRRRLAWGWSFGFAVVIALGLAVAGRLAGGILQTLSGVDLIGNLRQHPGGVMAAGAAVFDGVLALGLWALCIVFPFAVRDGNTRALEADRLRTAAELARLRAHMQPHFLLNTLNTVSGLVGTAPEQARELIGALGDLLRDALEETGEMHTLDDEVAWLRRYAQILEIRHRGRLEFHWAVAEETRGFSLPRLLLQPLLENAVTHGALRRRGGGQVTVATTLDDHDRVRCVIEDNGPGPASPHPRAGARGIQLVTRRLAVRYGAAASFRLEAGHGRTRSIVEIAAERAP